ncbi:hypothetical protein [Shewanella sedimentimangrovi]|uniref:Uncharacterized protein n=1 Tax=Shewanella sedimentimangrovi TaxID=2814293 RepID=A0ABX7R539_9GAMM|nr:hypothetical protein [Shewanella sedimentimangrovi]QSX38276.1 hypothetical protein JYB85_05465 [Shewanella sedimentimangrovi]
MRRDQRKPKQPSSWVDFLLGQFAAAVFAVPTALLLWFFVAESVGWVGFWLILGCFAFVSVFFPKAFPDLLGKIWEAFFELKRWY